MPASRPSVLSALAGVLTVGAGLVHAAAAGAHGGDAQLVALFALTALAQVLAGTALVAGAGTRALAPVIALNLGVAGAWAVSRLAGLPLVDALREAQPVGVQDLTATLMEVAAAGVALAAFRYRPSLIARRLSPVWALALVPALVGMAAPHSHPDGGEGSEVGHRAGAGGGSSLAADPIFSGLDTSHASEADLAAARDLILVTRDAVVTSFPDEAAVVRAGYQSIGDGRVGRYEHFLHAGYLTDGRELDPGRIESIVLEQVPGGKRVASAMYILDVGKTMADVPNVAGDLTVWHDHQNLCWDESGIRLAGVLLDGQCFPRGTFRSTPPMLHVWLHDHECGPFAGIEGHGGRCAGHTD